MNDDDDAFTATSCYFCFLNWVILIFLLFDNVIDFICNIIVGFVCGLFMMVLVLVLVMVSGVKFLVVIDGGLYGVNFGE